MDLNIEKFSPAKADLVNLAEKAKLITKESPLEEIHEVHATLRSTRTSITKTGKVMREDAIAFQKAVIAKEKELIALIEPEENRITAIEEEIEIAKEREERKALLPQRKARLEAIDKDLLGLISDEEILDMDSTAFEGYLNAAHAEKNRAEQEKIDAEKAKIEAEKAALAREKEMQERDVGVRHEERERAEREAKEANERHEREAKEKSDREAREKAEAEQSERFEGFLAGLGITDQNREQFTFEHTDSSVIIWKKIGEFDKKMTGK